MSTPTEWFYGALALVLFVCIASLYLRANARLNAKEREMRRRAAQTAPFRAAMSHSKDHLSV